MILKLFDTLGQELQLNDIVKIQSERNKGLTFYTRIKIIKGQIYPLNSFTFDRIIKINEIPKDAVYHPLDINNRTPEYWMHPHQELDDIKKDIVDTWRMKSLLFDWNPFYKVYED